MYLSHVFGVRIHYFTLPINVVIALSHYTSLDAMEANHYFEYEMDLLQNPLDSSWPDRQYCSSVRGVTKLTVP